MKPRVSEIRFLIRVFFFLFFLYPLPFTLYPPLLWAQFDFQFGVGPGGMESYGSRASTGPVAGIGQPVEPFAQALSDELLKTKTTDYWANIGVASSTCSQEFSSYVSRGFGRTELVRMILIADAGNQKLADIARKRVRGAAWKELVEEFKLSFEDIRQRSAVLKKKLEEVLLLKKKEPQEIDKPKKP